MINQINLVPRDVSQIGIVGKTIGYLKIVSRGIAVALVIIVVIEYIWVYQTKNQLAQINSQISSLNATLQEEFPVEVKYLRDQKVLQQAGGIVSKRKNYQNILAALYSFFPTGISVQGLSFSDQVLLLSARGSDVQAFSGVINNIQSKASSSDTKVFGNVALVDLRRTENGNYDFSLQMELLNPI